jgi:hypothetical protein
MAPSMPRRRARARGDVVLLLRDALARVTVEALEDGAPDDVRQHVRESLRPGRR